MGVVATIDNIFYALSIGDRFKLHAVPTFLGANGGILAFGAVCLIFGLAVMSVKLALVAIIENRFAQRQRRPFF